MFSVPRVILMSRATWANSTASPYILRLSIRSVSLLHNLSRVWRLLLFPAIGSARSCKTQNTIQSTNNPSACPKVEGALMRAGMIVRSAGINMILFTCMTFIHTVPYRRGLLCDGPGSCWKKCLLQLREASRGSRFLLCSGQLPELPDKQWHQQKYNISL